MPVVRRRSKAFTQAFGEALRLVVLDYANFVRGWGELQEDEDPKLFGTRHAAAKACLAHLTELLKLVGEDAGAEHVRDGFALLHEAQAALGVPQDDEDPPQDGRGDG
ncbi:MAG: hypothetical protein K2X49_19005 [Acetobacteraceae bacterium]|nr:hypothetical protein [Acetobacteraceae bacterium]